MLVAIRLHGRAPTCANRERRPGPAPFTVTPIRRGSAASLRGDLDWMTLKAFAKDRMRRYDSASALAIHDEASGRDLAFLKPR